MDALHNVRVRPRSRAQLRNTADQLRSFCRVKGPYVPIVEMLELHLAKLGVVYEYVSKTEMGNNHGVSFPDQGLIRIREDVYERACAGEGRDRLTIAHEVGHVILHGNLSLARSATNPRQMRPFESSEWQANAFAGELLMPLRWILSRCHGPHDLSHTFGVSAIAANTQWAALRREGKIKA